MPAATCSIIIGNNVLADLLGTGTRNVSLVSLQISHKTHWFSNNLPQLYLCLLKQFSSISTVVLTPPILDEKKKNSGIEFTVKV